MVEIRKRKGRRKKKGRMGECAENRKEEGEERIDGGRKGRREGESFAIFKGM